MRFECARTSNGRCKMLLILPSNFCLKKQRLLPIRPAIRLPGLITGSIQIGHSRASESFFTFFLLLIFPRLYHLYYAPQVGWIIRHNSIFAARFRATRKECVLSLQTHDVHSAYLPGRLRKFTAAFLRKCDVPLSVGAQQLN